MGWHAPRWHPGHHLELDGHKPPMIPMGIRGGMPDSDCQDSAALYKGGAIRSKRITLHDY